MNNESCLFCKIISGAIPCERIFENDRVFAFLDINPVNKGHTLVIPKTHAINISDISKEDFSSIMETVRALAPQIKSGMKADGINIIMNNDPAAGQIIFHAHIHIIPRFASDGFHHWKGTPYEATEQSDTALAIRKELSA